MNWIADKLSSLILWIVMLLVMSFIIGGSALLIHAWESGVAWVWHQAIDRLNKQEDEEYTQYVDGIGIVKFTAIVVSDAPACTVASVLDDYATYAKAGLSSPLYEKSCTTLSKGTLLIEFKERNLDRAKVAFVGAGKPVEVWVKIKDIRSSRS
jgi:hypothetical protein